MRTYAIVSDFGEPDHLRVLAVYDKIASVRLAYPRMRQIYGPGGKKNSRCWAASLSIPVSEGDEILRGSLEFHLIHKAPILKSFNGDLMDQRPSSPKSKES